MRTPTINILTITAIILLFFACASYSDENNNNIEIYPMDDVNPIVFQAPIIESVGNIIRAYGGVRIFQGNSVMTASEAVYDYSINYAVLKDAVFTTCSGDCPDYKITANEIVIYPGDRINARGVGLYIKNTRILSLPSWRGRIDGNTRSDEVFPTPGYDREDGFTLKKSFRLIDKPNMLCFLDLTYGTNSSFLGSVQNEIALDGNITDFPSRFLTYGSIRSNALNLNPQDANFNTRQKKEKRSKIRFRQKVSLSERINDIGDKNLKVFSIPEISFEYIEDGINLTGRKVHPRLVMHPQVEVLWSRFKEVPGPNEYKTRYYANTKIPINAYMPNDRTAIHPAVSYDWVQYANDNTYKHWAWYMDIAHLTSRGSLLNLRYVRRYDQGATEFEIDNVDIKEELQAGLHYENKRHAFGAVLFYNMSEKSLYEWETFYAYKTDCLAGWFRWNNRLNRLVMNVTLINF